MNLNLNNKVVLITGSSKGLGKGIAKAFLEENARVFITGRNGHVLNSTLEEFRLKFSSKNVQAFKGDLTVDDDIQKCVQSCINQFGRIDILVANLGSGRSLSDWNISNSEWEKVLNLNFISARKITDYVVPYFIKIKQGNIIYISSIAGKEIIGAPIAYSVAKSALISYGKNLSFKLANYNIRVNTICPGNIYFKNGTWDIKIKENKQLVEQLLKEKVPLQRFTTPEEVANIVLFISSDKASFITGSTINVDGGQTVSI